MDTDTLVGFLTSLHPYEAARCTTMLRHHESSKLVLQWTVCRMLLLNLRENLRILENSHYCSDSFYIIVIDSHRTNIARLRSVKIAHVDELVQDFERVFAQMAEFNGKSAIAPNSHVTLCYKILREVGLVPDIYFSLESLWRHTIHLLDLGILSYAGAHIERIDERYLGSQISNIPVLAPFPLLDCNIDEHGKHETQLANQMNMRRRRLQ
jgi:hypothetical protein